MYTNLILLAGVQAVFHIAAIVGPFFPHELYEKVRGVYDRIGKLAIA